MTGGRATDAPSAGGTGDPHHPVVVVTGASRGLGAGLAVAFAERGMRLGLSARTVPASASMAAAEPRVCSSRCSGAQNG